MAIKELEDLLKLASDADRASLEQLLERNSALSTRLQSQDLTYRAILEGDEQANKLLEQALKQPAGTASSTATTSATAVAAPDLNTLLAEIDKRVSPLAARLDKDLSDDRIKTIAKQVAEELAPQFRATALEQADTIYTIRDAHQREFGEPLVRADFEKFVTDNPGKYSNLASAHDAFVQEKRIEKIKTDAKAAGRAEAEAERANANLPGSTIPSSGTLASIFQANPANKVAADNGRGVQLDKAAAAFRSLQAGRAN